MESVDINLILYFRDGIDGPRLEELLDQFSQVLEREMSDGAMYLDGDGPDDFDLEILTDL